MDHDSFHRAGGRPRSPPPTVHAPDPPAWATERVAVVAADPGWQRRVAAALAPHGWHLVPPDPDRVPGAGSWSGPAATAARPTCTF